jgi:hypothetical protein
MLLLCLPYVWDCLLFQLLIPGSIFLLYLSDRGAVGWKTVLFFFLGE